MLSKFLEVSTQRISIPTFTMVTRGNSHMDNEREREMRGTRRGRNEKDRDGEERGDRDRDREKRGGE